MTAFLKPVLVPDPVSRPFWDGCARHQLLIQQCASCGQHRHPPGPACPRCGSREARWVEASGRGRVFSWIVVRHPVPSDVYRADVPYVVALIELDEGVRLVSNIVGCDPDSITADMAVSVSFVPYGAEHVLPQFAPSLQTAF
jgi:uncharacterized OB-fold protein